MKKTMTVLAKDNRLDDVKNFVTENLEAEGCSEKTLMQLELAVEESFVNIAHYAYPPETGTVTVTKELTDDGLLIVVLSDSGTPYDPLKKPDPDLTLPLDKKPIGGLGIYMTKKSMDKVSYEYQDGKNILTLEKKLR